MESQRPFGDMQQNTTPLTEQTLINLMQLLHNDERAADYCLATYNLLDEYVDMITDKADAAALMPLVKHHIDLCPMCREKYEILLDILQAEL